MRKQLEVGTVRTAKVTTLLTFVYKVNITTTTHATVLKCIKKLDKE